MGKKRIVSFKSDAVPVEHLDGGTFHVRPLNFDEALRYADILTKQDFVRDDDGAIIFGPNNLPLTKAASKLDDQIVFAASLVERVDDVELEDGKPFEATQENLIALLKLMGRSEIEIDLDQNGKEFTGAKGQVKSEKKSTKIDRENLFFWVIRVATRLGKQKQEIERGNS